MAGKLELTIAKKKSNEQKEVGAVAFRDVHGGLEQLVQVVHPLHQLERDANQEELLQLVDEVAAGADSHRDGREQTARGDDDVEHVPAIGAETPPAESVETHEDVYHVHDGDEQEKIVCTISGISISET